MLKAQRIGGVCHNIKHIKGLTSFISLTQGDSLNNRKLQ